MFNKADLSDESIERVYSQKDFDEDDSSQNSYLDDLPIDKEIEQKIESDISNLFDNLEFEKPTVAQSEKIKSKGMDPD